MRVALAMSGGVDSAVAGLLLKKAGHQVYGLHMRLSPDRGEGEQAARKIADFLEIPLDVVNLAADFKRQVIDYLDSEYSRGLTPNPCSVCNARIKFGLLWQKAQDMGRGVEKMATGHYARIASANDQRQPALLKGVDGNKDQSYFLALLRPEQLERSLFPLGGLTKTRVIGIAREAGLPISQNNESQDFCLGAYRQFLTGGRRAGDFIDSDNRVLGRHSGIGNYTIGQRRGLRIAAAAPLYVTAMNANNNQIVLGPESALWSHGLLLNRVNNFIDLPVTVSVRGQVKARYRDPGTKAYFRVASDRGGYQIDFAQAKKAITPGQVAAFYQDDRLLFSGIITKSLTDSSTPVRQ